MWRAGYADRSYDIWAAISKDNGKTFSKSLKVGHARSPASDPYRNTGLFGDDIHDLSTDKDNVHIVWGDSRAGCLGGSQSKSESKSGPQSGGGALRDTPGIGIGVAGVVISNPDCDPDTDPNPAALRE